jgi:succinoglycan biosynthesis transport protein ExoP
LQTRLNLYQQVYFNLTVLGESLGTGGQSLRMNQLQTTLALYQQIYSNLLNNYESVRLARLRSTPNVVQIEQAPVPSKPVRPQPLRNSALGAATGVIIMGAIAFLIEYLDDTVRSPEEVTRQLGLPVLGLIASHPSHDNIPIAMHEPRSPVSEAFRSLRTNIQFATVDKPIKTILVTSPSPQEGKSTVATNLAVVLAQGDSRVVLLDTDLRRPMIHKLLNLPNQGGVSGLILQLQVYLDGKINLNGGLQQTVVRGLRAMPSGKLPPNPAELLASDKMSKVIQEVRNDSDVVVMDSPPVLAVTDASVLASRVDGVLLVLRPGVTKLAAARGAVEQLKRVGANLLGVVLNNVEFKRSGHYYYHYKGYYYNYNGHYGEKTAVTKNHNHKRFKVRTK